MDIKNMLSSLTGRFRSGFPARREYAEEPPYGAYPGEDGYAEEPPYGAYPGEDGYAEEPPYGAYPGEDGCAEEPPYGAYPGEEGYEDYPMEPEELPLGAEQLFGDGSPYEAAPPDEVIPDQGEAPDAEAADEDIPVEEFTLDELDAEEPPAPLYEEEQPPESAEPPELWTEEAAEAEQEREAAFLAPPEDPRRRPRLLSRRGRLRHPGWAETDKYEYNKEDLRRPSRRKEWEIYELNNERFSFRVTYGHCAYMGITEVSLLDFATGERFTTGKRQLLPGDRLDLDFSGGQPHSLKYEDGELFLSVSFDGDVRRLLVRSKEFDADISCHDDGDAIVTAVPFEAKAQFAYNYKKVFLDLSGHLTFRNTPRKLDRSTFLMLWSGRGIWPYRYSSLWAMGAMETQEGILALNLGGGYGRSGAPTENAVFVNGRLDKLGRVRFKFSADNYMKRWRIGDRDHRLRLEFIPAYDDADDKNYLLIHNTVHQVFGHLSGTVELSDGTVREIENMPFFFQHGVYRW